MQFPAEITPQDLLLQILQETGGHVLASPEDAAFFRAEFMKKPLAKPTIIPQPVIKESAPKPIEKQSITENIPIAPKSIPKAESPIKQVEPKKVEAPEVPAIDAPIIDFLALRTMLANIAPELAILQEIPNDLIARKLAERWKTKNQTAPISILCGQESPEQRALLEQITRALDVYFGGAKLVQAESIEKEKQWEAFLSVADLKTVIVCDYTLWQLGGLMQFYKETPAQGTRMLGNVPLFLLPDLSLYLKDPLLKRSLWKALCQKFS